MKADKAKAIASFNAGTDGFNDRDLYPFCLNISEVQPLSGANVRLVMVGDGLEVRVPVDRVGERLGVMKNLMQRIYKEFPEPAYLDLRFAGQAVVGGKAAQQRAEKGGDHGAG